MHNWCLVFAFGTVFLEERPPALCFSQGLSRLYSASGSSANVYINQQKTIDGRKIKASVKLNSGLVAVILFSLLTLVCNCRNLFKKTKQ